MCIFVLPITDVRSDELDYLPVLVSLPPKQTVFEYLVGCWKRINATRSAAIKKVSVPPSHFVFLISAELYTVGRTNYLGQTRHHSHPRHQLHWFDYPRTRNVPPTLWVSFQRLFFPRSNPL